MNNSDDIATTQALSTCLRMGSKKRLPYQELIYLFLGISNLTRRTLCIFLYSLIFCAIINRQEHIDKRKQQKNVIRMKFRNFIRSRYTLKWAANKIKIFTIFITIAVSNGCELLTCFVVNTLTSNRKLKHNENRI
uniref:Uncharacterized protein n=1 Tax=Glossina brevipalpis TaxID=37001 RepID=A0A1A9WVJ7_9MUSC